MNVSDVRRENISTVTTFHNCDENGLPPCEIDGVQCCGQASIKTSLAREPLAPLEVALFPACADRGASGGVLGGGVSVVSDVMNASRGSVAGESNEPPTDDGDASDSEEAMVCELEREMTESDDPVHRCGQASIKTSLAIEPLAPLGVLPLPRVSADLGASGGGLGGGVSVVSDVSSVGVKRRASADSDIVGPRTKIRSGVAYVTASSRTAGAIVAPSRTGEGRGLPCGNQRTCLVDATFNGALTLDPTSPISLAKLRTAAIPKLGNVLEASWGSVDGALAAQNAPFWLKESTATFRAKGGMMLNILNAPAGVYVATTLVTVCGKPNRHAICVSTLPEAHCPLGKMIDNASTTKPVYIEAEDQQHKPGARRAFKQLFAQRVGHDDFFVELKEIFQLVAA